MKKPYLCEFLLQLATDDGVLTTFKNYTAGTNANSYDDFAAWLSGTYHITNSELCTPVDDLYNWDTEAIAGDIIDELNSTASGDAGYSGGSTLTVILPMDHLQRQFFARIHLQRLSEAPRRPTNKGK
ncbi:MAG: hypothetical protein JOY69_02780 [Candidatus Eremiobacteraeota bacterium]|nr:hypothetical protein [Candidatus Eremiobacteraeota bacterium]